MRIVEMNWMQVETYLEQNDLAVLPLGSTEQHAYLSLGTDTILPDRLAAEAAEPLGIPVFPALPYGLTVQYQAFPGTITLQPETYLRLLHDLLQGIAQSGFKRILIVNGHGGNDPAQAAIDQWTSEHSGVRVRYFNWWDAPKTLAKMNEIDALARHASWSENFPWTRLPGVSMPMERKAPADKARLRMRTPKEVRAALVDGNNGGLYQRSDEEVLALWAVAVAETRAILSEEWG